MSSVLFSPSGNLTSASQRWKLEVPPKNQIEMGEATALGKLSSITRNTKFDVHYNARQLRPIRHRNI